MKGLREKMKLPNEILEKIENLANAFKRKELVKTFQEVSERYCGEKQGESLVAKRKETIAYAIVRMPATYGAVSSAVSQIMTMFSQEEIGKMHSLLDIGAGTGAATLAISNQIPLEEISCLEREDGMLALGKELFSVSSQKEVREAVWKKRDVINEKITENADIVVVSYMLNEMVEEKRYLFLEEIWKHTNQLLIIVDPGTPKDFQNIIKMKDFLAEKGANIIAPCSCEKGCPLPKEDWCHFLCRVERTKLQKSVKEADVPFEDEKFTYLAVTKQKFEKTKCRVIRHPVITSNWIEVKVCQNGNVEKLVFTKKEKEKYKMAKKLKVGDCILY